MPLGYVGNAIIDISMLLLLMVVILKARSIDRIKAEISWRNRWARTTEADPLSSDIDIFNTPIRDLVAMKREQRQENRC